MSHNNPLLDEEFLLSLFEKRERKTYARIIALTFQENPIELIEGSVTQGSINIDGSSAVRRTCNLTIVTDQVNINDFYWGLKNKFRLEIGLENTINENYPEIIWFPQGTFVIASFNTSLSASNRTISISGKDKMCLLNGDLGGSLIASIDFGTEEYLDKTSKTIIYKKIPIKNIIREALHTYALEPYHNIIINDLDEAAVELLEYRGNVPLYLLRDVATNQFTNYTDNGTAKVRFENGEEYFSIEELESKGGYYDTRVELAPEAQANEASKLIFEGDSQKTIYTVAKIEYGQTVGYRYTDLTYAGDLISGIGEALTSILDKIKNMLGNYEYFYDIDGRFIFQRKRTYVSSSWNNIIKVGEEQYVESAAHSSAITFRFEGNKLITAFQNTPQLNNLKNDYSIWGSRKSVSGEKIPIHYRYAIDLKPTEYNTLSIGIDDISGYPNLTTQESKKYSVDEYDWRELIYQMALDYYKYGQLDCYATRLAESNETYQGGVTGYEQYYIDLQGFWRQLYDINPEPTYLIYPNEGLVETFSSNGEKLYIKGRYQRIDIDNIPDGIHHNDIYALLEINDKPELQTWLNAIQIPEYNNEEYYEDAKSKIFYVAIGNEQYEQVEWDVRNQYSKAEIFVKESDNYVTLINSEEYREKGIENFYIFIEDDNYYEVTQLEDDSLKDLYYITDNNNMIVYNKYLNCTPLDIVGNPINGATAVQTTINYYSKEYDYIIDENNIHHYWTKELINNPSQLNFWFDFLDGSDSELGQFSVPMVGDRAKVVNEDSVTAIYFREVPNLIFTTYQQYVSSGMEDDGYIPVFINGNLESMFTISSQGQSAQDKLNELLYSHSYCIESISISAIPVYTLQPNTRIFVRDDVSNVNGEYIVSKITIPLQYNGVMSISATKAPERLY